MKGKLVNLLLGLLNVLIGVVIIMFSMYIPTDLTTLTVQEKDVVKVIEYAVDIVIGITSFINFIAYLKNKTNYKLSLGYRIFLFTLFFLLIKQYVIAIFPIISALIIVKEILKENIREIESTTAISIIAVIAIATVVLDLTVYFYQNIGAYVLAKKNENQTEYSDTFFKYITELEGVDKYINVKKDGKYGYINTKGETVLDFNYDFATPFTTINVYNKEFQIALVCSGGTSKIIMKNGRVVKSYVSESSDEDYQAKIDELANFYNNTIGMANKMTFEINAEAQEMNYAPVYHETSEDYTYRYNYNDEYDITVTQSSMGLKDTYALVKKGDDGFKLPLDCENLDYDENALYLYQDGTIPFFNPEKEEQGWFSPRGVKKSMKGKAQILEKMSDRFLYKDYSKNAKISFHNEKGEKLSDYYKDIYIQNGRYIVKKDNDKYTILDENYNQIIENEYDYVDTSLLDSGIYLFGNVDDVIEFNDYDYADLKFVMLDYDGNVINDNLEQVYSKYYKISDDSKKAYVSRYNDFIENLKSLDNHFVGDKFYKK